MNQRSRKRSALRQHLNKACYRMTQLITPMHMPFSLYQSTANEDAPSYGDAGWENHAPKVVALRIPLIVVQHCPALVAFGVLHRLQRGERNWHTLASGTYPGHQHTSRLLLRKCRDSFTWI